MTNRSVRSRISLCGVVAAIGMLITLPTHGQGASKTPEKRSAAARSLAYTPPGARRMLSPGYPDELREAGQEGWVLLTLMVDRSGNAYEAAVVDSNGFEELEKSALANIETAKFQPAKLGSRRIDGLHRLNYNFTMQERTPLSIEFRDLHNPASTAIAQGDRQRADELLASIKARSLNEDGLLNMLMHQYHKRWGTPSEQLLALKRATGIEDPNIFLHSMLVSEGLLARLELQIQLNDFGAVLKTWEIIGKEKLTDKFTETFQATIDDIRARRSDDRSHTVAGEVDHRGSWFSHLLKRKFAIEVANGTVSRLKLRCERGFFSYPFEAGKQYGSDENAGACQLQVIGDPKTRLELRQS